MHNLNYDIQINLDKATKEILKKGAYLRKSSTHYTV